MRLLVVVLILTLTSAAQSLGVPTYQRADANGSQPATSAPSPTTNAPSQTGTAQTPAPAPKAPTKADILRGAYGRYRANNDLRFYHLNIRVDPEKKFLSGKNTIRFKMLKDDTRIQIDQLESLNRTHS